MTLCKVWFLSCPPLLYLPFPHFIFYLFLKFLKWSFCASNIASTAFHLFNPQLENSYPFSSQRKQDFLWESWSAHLYLAVLPLFLSNISLLRYPYSYVLLTEEYWLTVLMKMMMMLISDDDDIGIRNLGRWNGCLYL